MGGHFGGNSNPQSFRQTFRPPHNRGLNPHNDSLSNHSIGDGGSNSDYETNRMGGAGGHHIQINSNKKIPIKGGKKVGNSLSKNNSFNSDQGMALNDSSGTLNGLGTLPPILNIEKPKKQKYKHPMVTKMINPKITKKA